MIFTRLLNSSEIEKLSPEDLVRYGNWLEKYKKDLEKIEESIVHLISGTAATKKRFQLFFNQNNL